MILARASPFNLFANDLIETLKKSVPEMRKCIIDALHKPTTLLHYLKHLLDTTFEWCDTWHVKINTLNIKCMHFRQTSAHATNFIFKIDKCSVDIVPTYNNIGLMLKIL